MGSARSRLLKDRSRPRCVGDGADEPDDGLGAEPDDEEPDSDDDEHAHDEDSDVQMCE